MTEAVPRGKDATLDKFIGSIPEKIIRYLTLIFPETKQAITISQSINENPSSVRKALRRLLNQGQLDNPFNGHYRLSKDLFQLSGKSVAKCGMEAKKIPNFLRKQLPPELHFLQLGYPVESHGFHFSAYPVEGSYKRIRFEEKFKSGRVKFDCYPGNVEIKFGCRDDPLDAIELCYLYDFILEKLTQLSGKDKHNVICKQHDLHQDRHDYSYKGKRVVLEVLQQTLSLAAYETSRKDHPLVQQDKYLRNESRISFPAQIPDITFAMARVSAGVFTDLSQKNLNTTMMATMKQLNYERFNHLADIKETSKELLNTSSRIDINKEEETAAIFRIEESQREQKDIAAAIERNTGIVAEAITHYATAESELKEQMIEDHDNLQLLMQNVQDSNNALSIENSELLQENRYEHQEIHSRFDSLEKRLLQQEKKKVKPLPELGLYLLEILALNPRGLQVEQIIKICKKNKIRISRSRISQLFNDSEIKKHLEKTDPIYSGKRGRPRKLWRMKKK
ncbi:MAG: hypothetical protein ACTSYH_12155 [Candidatus Heimdallarchaeaceae archaeon]